MTATYMKITDISGDVTAKGHESWIALESLLFQSKRIIHTDPGRIADREGTRPTLSEITAIKKMDKSSPLLFSESCVGKAKPEIQIHLCQTASQLNPYVQITLNNVIVSGYHLDTGYFDQSMQDIQQRKINYPLETITLNFDKIEVKYIPYNEKNEAQSPIPAAYDLKEATSA